MEKVNNPINRKYKYAADYGLILGGYIAFFFILDFFFTSSVLFNILNILGFFATPIVCYYLAKQYREKAWGGIISFGQVWSFGVWLFLFASLIMSVLYYVRYQFIQPTYIANAFNQALLVAEQMKYSKEQMDLLVSNGVPTTIQLVLVYLWIYVICGAIIFLIIAPLVARKKPLDTPNETGVDKSYEPYQDTNDSNKTKL